MEETLEKDQTETKTEEKEQDLSIGQILKNAREEKHFDIEQIAEVTSFRAESLLALENDDYSAFQGDVYIKGTIRGYGNFLGLNGLELVEMYKVKQGQPTGDNKKNKGIREVDNVKMNISLRQEPGVGTQTNFSKDNNTGHWKYCVLGIVVVAGIIGVYYALPSIFDINGNSQSRDTSKAVTQSETGFFEELTGKISNVTETISNLISGVLSNSDEKKEEKKNSDVNATGSKGEISVVTNKMTDTTDKVIKEHYDKVVVEMTANAQCWIDVFADGKAIYSGMMTKNRYKIFEANKQITVKYGNISAMQVVVNGRPVSTKGSGGVVTKTYTKQTNQ